MDRPTRTVNAARALALGAMLLLPGCSVFDSPTVQRGNRVTDEMLAQITPGVQTRQDVQALLGSPTQSSTFSDGSWYYISSNTRARPGRELAVTDQRTVVVLFDGRGVVREVKTLGESDGQPVLMVARETPTPGNERTLLQALFGNIGRIGPGAAQAGTGPGTIAPGPGQIR
jgi:outer membrane protein assembly factor BamE (lipoprotein component of BamABCDE complex)